MQATYTLIIDLPHPRNIPVGKRGVYSFDPGNYAYVGSALNGLENRIARHLRQDKKLHWHIDFLLQYAGVREVVYVESSEKWECSIARELLKTLEPVPGFGCSDCRCLAHLFFSENSTALSEVVLDAFRSLRLVPVETSCFD